MIATCGTAALSLACFAANADPITSQWLSQDLHLADSQSGSASAQAEKADGQTALEKTVRIDPTDLVTSAPPKKSRAKKSISFGRQAASPASAEEAGEVPEIPWEMIELSLLRQNQTSSARVEPDIVVGGEYQQLIIDSLPDLALDIVYLQGIDDIPILNFLRTQSDSVAIEIATFTSDLADPDQSFAMASNGNLESDEAVSDSGLAGDGVKPPSLLKKLFFWGLGLLVLYTVLETVFSRLKRQGQGPVDARSRGEPKAERPRRRRTFGRSRTRHRSA